MGEGRGLWAQAPWAARRMGRWRAPPTTFRPDGEVAGPPPTTFRPPADFSLLFQDIDINTDDELDAYIEDLITKGD